MRGVSLLVRAGAKIVAGEWGARLETEGRSPFTLENMQWLWSPSAATSHKILERIFSQLDGISLLRCSRFERRGRQLRQGWKTVAREGHLNDPILR